LEIVVMDRSVEVVEHPGEVRLRLRAESFGALAVVAGRALAELELRRVPGEGAGAWREVAVTGRDAEALLVNWLNELIYLAETERWMGVEYTMVGATDTTLRMRVRGITVERAPSCVKAATFHGLHVVPVPGGLEADIVLDV
jgi:SHS2 domain-containing protein